MQFKGLLLPALYLLNFISFAKNNLSQFRYWPCKWRGAKGSLKSIRILQLPYDLIVGLHNNIRERPHLKLLIWVCKNLGTESAEAVRTGMCQLPFYGILGYSVSNAVGQMPDLRYIFHQAAAVNCGFDVLCQLLLDGSIFSNNSILTRY